MMWYFGTFYVIFVPIPLFFSLSLPPFALWPVYEEEGEALLAKVEEDQLATSLYRREYHSGWVIYALFFRT